jgi:hypothetical protein
MHKPIPMSRGTRPYDSIFAVSQDLKMNNTTTPGVPVSTSIAQQGGRVGSGVEKSDVITPNPEKRGGSVAIGTRRRSGECVGVGNVEKLDRC